MPNFVHDQIRKHLLESCGFYKKEMPSLESLKETEWSERFEELMRANLIMSSFRYGLIEQAKAYDYVTSIRQRLDLFEETGNAQHLVDISNICLVIFEKKMHKNFYYDHIDDGVHAKEL